MTDKNQETGTRWGSAERDPLDRILDAALAKYATVEPRIGLEDRVLANLRAEGAQASRNAGWRWWQWTAAAVAAAIVVAMFAWRSGMPTHPAIAHRPAISTPGAKETEAQSALNGNGKPTHVRTRRTPTDERPAHPNPAVAAAAPKLDVFPSPQPLSEQEKILANYVAQFHDQAILIARVTNEELKRDRLEVFGSSENPDEVADQQTTNR